MSEEQGKQRGEAQQQPLIRTVLIGAATGPEGDERVRDGLDIARALGANVHLTHAVPLDIAGSGLELLLTSDDIGGLRDSGIQQLERQIRRLEIRESELIGLNVDIGPPHRVIVDTAQRMSADLLVVGASESRSSQCHHLGSTADRVLRCAPCPTLILKGKSPLHLHRVLAPVDLSPCSAQALRSGLAFLSQLGNKRGVEVETLFVLSTLRHMVSQFSPEQIDQFALEELSRFTRENSKEWQGWVRSRMRIGDPRHQLLRELEERPVDLLVVGSHGHGFHRRALIGSVAAQIARRAECSVFVGPPTGLEEIERQPANSVFRVALEPIEHEDYAEALSNHMWGQGDESAR